MQIEKLPKDSTFARIKGEYVYNTVKQNGMCVAKMPITFPVFDEKIARFPISLVCAHSPGLVQSVVFFLAHGRMLARRITVAEKTSPWKVNRDKICELYEKWWEHYIQALIDLCSWQEFHIEELIVALDHPQHALLSISTTSKVLYDAPSPMYLSRDQDKYFAFYLGGHDVLLTNSVAESTLALFAEAHSAQEFRDRLALVSAESAYKKATTQSLMAAVAQEKKLVPTLSNEDFLRATGFPLGEIVALTGDLAGTVGPSVSEMLFASP